MAAVTHLKGMTYPRITRPGILSELMMTAHFIQRNALEQLTRGHGYTRLSLAFVDYVQRLAQRDYSPGELAAELGVSKQACSNVLRELQDQNLILRRPNPSDSRSSLLSLSGEGRALVRMGAKAAGATLDQLQASIGASGVRQLTGVLEKLGEGLQLSMPDAVVSGGAHRLSLLLQVLANYGRAQLDAQIAGRGFDRIGATSGHVFGLIAAGTSQMRDIGEVIGITKQAVALAAADLGRLGYVTRIPDPHDGRQILLQLTPRGEALVAAGAQAVKSIEQSFEALLDAPEYQLLGQAMETWFGQLAEIYDPARVLALRIRNLSAELLADLGPAGARALAQNLMTISKGKI